MLPLFYAHSGLRYLVLLAGFAAVAYFAWSAFGGRQPGRASRVLIAVFAGLMDLQIVLGLILVATGLYYPAVLGHMLMMLIAAAVVHVAAVIARNAEPPRPDRIRLAGAAIALVLIALGILSIGRGLFQSAGPSMGA